MNAATSAASKLYGQKELPLYKDKPYYSKASGRRRGMMRKKRVIVLFIVVFVLVWLFGFSKKREESILEKLKIPVNWKGQRGKVDWNARREEVKQVFLESWEAYENAAWGENGNLLS